MLPSHDELVTLARADSAAGELALRRRRTAGQPDVHELIVNGAFAMDTVEVSSEVRLAGLTLAAGARTVLVGGLGLGFTAAALGKGGATRVDVVELAAPLVDWARSGLTPSLARACAYPVVHLHVADVRDVLVGDVAVGPGCWDAVVLDVDNGPHFLIRDANADLYAPALLAAAFEKTVPGGLLLVWSQGRAPDLADVLATLGTTVEHLVAVERDGHRIDYALYACSRPGTGIGRAVDQNEDHD